MMTSHVVGGPFLKAAFLYFWKGDLSVLTNMKQILSKLLFFLSDAQLIQVSDSFPRTQLVPSGSYLMLFSLLASTLLSSCIVTWRSVTGMSYHLSARRYVPHTMVDWESVKCVITWSTSTHWYRVLSIWWARNKMWTKQNCLPRMVSFNTAYSPIHSSSTNTLTSASTYTFFVHANSVIVQVDDCPLKNNKRNHKRSNIYQTRRLVGTELTSGMHKLLKMTVFKNEYVYVRPYKDT